MRLNLISCKISVFSAAIAGILIMSLLLSPVVFAIPASIETYLDAGHTKPSLVFKEDGAVFLKVYNGVTCCDDINVTAYTSSGKIFALLKDIGNNGYYTGSFFIGMNATNDTTDYLYAENSKSIFISAVLSPISSNIIEIKAEYGKPTAPLLELNFSKGVYLNWSGAEDESGIERYMIYRGFSENQTELIASISGLDYMDRTVVDGRQYYYKVRAVDSLGNFGEFSKTESVNIPDMSPPQEVNDLAAISIRDKKILLNWSEPMDNTGILLYLIYRSSGSNISEDKIFANASVTEYIDEKTEDGREYYYAVRAVDPSGNAAKFSNIANAKADATAPDPVNDLRFSLAKGIVNLEWSGCDCLYKIYESRFEITGKEDIAGIVPHETRGRNYTASIDGAAYFAVIVYDDAGNPSELSNIVRIEPDLTPPIAVTNLIVLADANKKINLSWTASQSADVLNYNIYRNDNADIFAQTNKTFYIDEDVTAGVEYSYIVKAIDFSGNEDNNTSGAAGIARDEIVLLDINYPKNGSDLNQDKISVIGRTDKAAIVNLENNINGTVFSYDAVVDKNGLFIGYAPLGEGENIIKVYAKDIAENEKSAEIKIKNRFAIVSNTSVESAINELKQAIPDNDREIALLNSDKIIDDLAKNDPNLAKDRAGVENYITGASASVGLSPLYAILPLIGIGASFVFYRLMKKDFKNIRKSFEQKLDTEIKEKKNIEAEKDILKRSFQKYIDPAVVQQVLTNNTKDVKRKISVLLIDVRGYTRLFEKHGDRTADFLDEYIDRTAKIIQKNNGIVMQLIGDMVYAGFGVVKQQDHAYLAAKTAFELKKEIAEFNKNIIGKGFEPIEVGIAIDSGKAIVGDRGSDRARTFAITGSPIITAWRMEDYAKKGEILISQNTYDIIKDRAVISEKKTIPIKGKPDAIVFSLTGLRQ